jgi:hypothetical protein
LSITISLLKKEGNYYKRSLQIKLIIKRYRKS